MKRSMLAVLCFCLALGSAVGVGAETSTPNVLLVVYDDLDFLGDLGPYGANATTLPTPFSDVVAAGGKRFDTFYANAAICSPTRVGLLSGLYPSRLGFTYVTGDTSLPGVPGDLPTLARLFKGMGYRTGAFGKWHAGKNDPDNLPAGVGFDQSAIDCTYTNIGVPSQDEPFPGAYGDTYDDAAFCRAPGDIRQDSGSTYATTYTSDKTLEFINGTLDLPVGQNPDPNPPPFFAQVWLHAPHTPLTCPPGYTCPSCDPQQGDATASDYCNATDYRAHYEAVVGHAESQLMRLYNELNNRSEWADTLVILTSDNGGTVRSQLASSALKGAKHNLYERGIRVPFLVDGPGISQGVVDEPVIGHDLLTTLASHFNQPLTGYDGSGEPFDDLIWGQGSGWQGAERPLLWEMRAPSKREHHALFYPWKSYAVRKQVLGETWKLAHTVLYGSGVVPELYKLTALDETETNNLTFSEKKIRHHLETELRHWRREDHAMEPTVTATSGSVTTNPDGSWTFTTPGAGQSHGVVELADHPALTLDNLDLSVSFTFTPSQVGSRARLVGRAGSWWVVMRGDNKLTLQVVTTNGTVEVVNRVQVVPDETYKVTAVYHHTRGVYLSVDDVHAKERVRAIHGVDTTQPLLVGRLSGGGDPFLGTIANLVFHPVVLSTADLELDTVYGTGFEPGEPAPFSNVVGGTLTVDTNTFHSGGQSLRHTSSSNDSYTTPWYGVPILVGVDDLNVQISAWVKGDGGAEDPVSLFLFCLDSAGNNISWDPRSFSFRQDLAIDEWRRLVHQHQCPSGTQSVTFRLDNDTAGRTVYWDDVRVSRLGKAFANLDFEGETAGQDVQSIFANDGFDATTGGYTGNLAMRVPASSVSEIEVFPYGGRNQFVTSLWAKADGPGTARLRIWQYCYDTGVNGLEEVTVPTGNCPTDTYPHASDGPTDLTCIRSFPATLSETWQKYEVWSSCPDASDHTGLRIETLHFGPDVLIDDLTFSVPSVTY